MRYSEVAIFSDLDGTLFSSDTSVSEANRKAIADFTGKGGIFSVCTGRTPANARPYLEGVEINAPGVFFNGAACYDCRRSEFTEAMFLNKNLILPYIGRVLDDFPDVNIQVYSKDEICFVSPADRIEDWFAEQHKPYVIRSLEESPDEWLKVLFMSDTDTLYHLRDEVLSPLKDSADTVLSSPRYLELLSKGVSKGTMIDRLRAYPELQGRTIFGIGDYSNDMEFLRSVDVPVCPGNAIPCVKDIAEYITSDNDNNAIASLIYEIIPDIG